MDKEELLVIAGILVIVFAGILGGFAIISEHETAKLAIESGYEQEVVGGHKLWRKSHAITDAGLSYDNKGKSTFNKGE
jgi:hypothetical protein